MDVNKMAVILLLVHFSLFFYRTLAVCCKYQRLSKSTSPSYGGVTLTSSVSENLAAASSVMSAAATDADSGDSLTYSVVSGQGDTYFDVDSSTGLIKTKTTLPLSGSNGHTDTVVEVQATDTCSNSATGTFTVSTTNVAPSFTNLPSTYSLSENVTTATSLLAVGVSDHPNTAALCCSLVRTNPSSTYFELVTSGNTYTLQLKSGSSLEHDTVSSYELFVCCDDGTLSSTSYLYVSITNTDPKITIEMPSFVLIGLIVCLIPVGILFGLSCALMIVTIYIR